MKKYLWIALALIIAVFVGCDFTSRDFYRAEDDFDDPTRGSLNIALDGGALPTKTIAPALDMNVAYYDLTFTGPTSSDDFSTQINAGAPDNGFFSRGALSESAEPDDWNVVADAYNSGDTRIGTATQDFTITAGQATNIDIEVLPLPGSGDLSLTLEWTTGVLVDASITASLNPQRGDISSNLAPDGFLITTGGSPDTGTYITSSGGTPDSLAPGYNTLILRLYDGTALVWGWMEAVRIVSGQTSSATWTLNLGAGGRVDLQASWQDPIIITLDSNPGTPEVDATPTNINQGDSLSILAIPDLPDDGTYSFQWYLDGAPLTDDVGGVEVVGSDTENVTFPTNSPLLTLGTHTLSVLLTAGVSADILSSEGFTFNVN